MEELVDRLPEELVGRQPEAFPHDTEKICILRGAALIRFLQSAVIPALGEIKMSSPTSF
jgi:hypothetical protein